MNIFRVHDDPVISAQQLPDIYCGSGRMQVSAGLGWSQFSRRQGGKMIVETSQLLATCYKLNTLEQKNCPRNNKGEARKHSYYNHPAAKWVRQSLGNFNWLVKHGQALISEKIHRGGSKHFSGTFIDWCGNNLPDNMDYPYWLIDKNIVTTFAQAMPQQYKVPYNSVIAYQKYLNGDKRHNPNVPMVWTNRDVPEWYKD